MKIWAVDMSVFISICILTISVNLVERPTVQRNALQLVSPRRRGEAGQRQCRGHDAGREEPVLQQLVHRRPPRGVRLQLQHYH